MKNVSKLISAIIMIIMAMVTVAAANTDIDSIGTVGKILYSKIENIPCLKEIAGLLTMAMLGAVYQIICGILNKVSVKYKFVNNKLVASFISRLLAKIFDKSSIYYNIKIDDKKLTVEEKKKAEELKIEMLKEHFKKHDPLLKMISTN